MNVAKLMTWITWGDTGEWIDPQYRNLNRTEEQIAGEEGARRTYNRDVDELRKLLVKK